MDKVQRKFLMFPIAIGLALTMVFFRLASIQMPHAGESASRSLKKPVRIARTVASSGMSRLRRLLHRFRIAS